MNDFIEVETNSCKTLVNLANVECIAKGTGDCANIYFTVGPKDCLETKETYEEVKRKISDVCKMWIINPSE